MTGIKQSQITSGEVEGINKRETNTPINLMYGHR